MLGTPLSRCHSDSQHSRQCSDIKCVYSIHKLRVLKNNNDHYHLCAHHVGSPVPVKAANGCHFFFSQFKVKHTIRNSWKSPLNMRGCKQDSQN